MEIRKRYYDEINESQVVRIKLPTVQEMKIELLARLLDPEEGLNQLMSNQLRTRLGLDEDYDPKKALGELRATAQVEGPQPELQP